jgi:hypothetical protein
VSLLGSGQTVLAFPDVIGADADGNPGQRRPGTESVPVVGRWQYEAPAEDTSEGQQVITRAKFLARNWPTGFAGRVTYDGREWDVIGEPTRSGLSPATRHTVVRLVARSARPIQEV